MIVADTCLIFHLYNETHLTSLAQEVLSLDSHWIVPPLWKEEYANILSKVSRKENLPHKKVIVLFEFTLDELSNCEVNVDTSKALETSLKYKISVYDAHFITLAMDFNTIVITEDKELLKKCSNTALSLEQFIQKI